MALRTFLIVLELEADDMVRTAMRERISYEYAWSYEMFRDVFVVLADTSASVIESTISNCLDDAIFCLDCSACESPQIFRDGASYSASKQEGHIKNIMVCELSGYYARLNNADSKRNLEIMIERRSQSQE